MIGFENFGRFLKLSNSLASLTLWTLMTVCIAVLIVALAADPILNPPPLVGFLELIG